MTGGLNKEDWAQPVPTFNTSVSAEWADYNGHMNEARYLDAFSDATDRFMNLIGCDGDYVAAGQSFFTVESHIRHLGETLVGQDISVCTQLLGAEGKKMHLWHELRVGDVLKATGEHMLIHVDLNSRRASLPGAIVRERLELAWQMHRWLELPNGAGRAIERLGSQKPLPR